jgi:hypothetical protein
VALCRLEADCAVTSVAGKPPASTAAMRQIDLTFLNSRARFTG